MVEITFMVHALKKNKKSFLPGSYYSAGFIIAAFTFAVYIPSLYNGFVNWDDSEYIYENKNIRSIGFNLIKWSFTDTKVGHWHPLTWFSFAMDHALWGINPLGYHLTNIIFHSLNTFMVFILTVNLVKYGHYEKDKSDKAALVTGLTTSIFFGIHPLHVESVAWATERKDVLSLFFILISLLSYIRYNSTEGLKRHSYYCTSLVLFILSLLTKPMAISLPIILLILDFYPFKRFGIGVDYKKTKWVLIEKLPFFVLSILSAIMTIWAANSAGVIMKRPLLPFVTRIIMTGRSYLFYLFKMIMPFNLAPLYPYPPKIDVLTLEYLGAFVLFLLITFFCLKSKRRVFTAVWLSYVVALIPVIGIIQAGPQAAADRYTYLPSLGLFLLAGLGISELFERLSKKQHRLIIIVALSVLIAILATRTVMQINVWHDSITLWSHEIRLFPNVSKAYHNRSEAYGSLENYNKALTDSNKAIEIDPAFADAYYNRGTIYYSLGDYQRAIEDLSRAIELKTRYYEKTYHNRGLAYQEVGKYQQAINDYNRAIELNPQDEFAYSNRGNAYFLMGDHQQAINDYDKAIEINPRYVDAYSNRGYVYYILDNTEHAINDLKRAVELDPQYAGAYDNLGLVYSRMGNDSLALTYYRKAASLGSKEAQEYLNKEGINK